MSRFSVSKKLKQYSDLHFTNTNFRGAFFLTRKQTSVGPSSSPVKKFPGNLLPHPLKKLPGNLFPHPLNKFPGNLFPHPFNPYSSSAHIPK